MKVCLKTRCRGDGKAYLLVRVTECPQCGSVGLLVRNDQGKIIPSELYSYDQSAPIDIPQAYTIDDGSLARAPQCSTVHPSLEGYMVAVFPLLSIVAWNLEFFFVDENGTVVERAAKVVSAKNLIWSSRFNYRFRSEDCAKIRDIDRSFAPLVPTFSFERIVETSEGVVVRTRCELPAATSADLVFYSFDRRGNALCLQPSILEDGTTEHQRLFSQCQRVVTLSFLLPVGQTGICVQVVDHAETWAPVFGMLDESSYGSLQNAVRLETLSAENDPKYADWYESHRATSSELTAQLNAEFINKPYFSIVVPLYKTPSNFFRAMLQSVMEQSYPYWELVLVNASPEDVSLADELNGIDDARVKVLTLQDNLGIAENTNAGIAVSEGDFIAFLDHDDMLAPDVLFEYARALRSEEEVDILYCDEDRFDEIGRHSAPFFKPEFSLELLRSHNYITHFLALRRDVLIAVGLLNAVYDGAQDYDLVLRASEVARNIVHIPRVLYHWRVHEGSTSVNADSKAYAREAGRSALESHFRRCGIGATVETTAMPFAYRVRYHISNQPKVSIVVPNKDKVSLLSVCIASILEKATYENYEIVVVENNSKESETFDYYEQLQKDIRVKVITWPGEFNFSKIINFAADRTKSDYILLLNNDTELISPDFIETMLGYFQGGNVGAVGCKLLYPDRTVQHGGVVLGPFQSAGHLFVSLAENDPGYFCRAILPQDISAVTGACQLIKRTAFDEVGGYSEEFTVGLNDVDFCLKLREAGYRIVFTPFSELFHYEFSSRGRDRNGARLERCEQELSLLRYRWPRYFVEGDPFSNPNLSSVSQYFGLGA